MPMRPLPPSRCRSHLLPMLPIIMVSSCFVLFRGASAFNINIYYQSKITVTTIPWRYLFPFPAYPLWASVPIRTSSCSPPPFPWHRLGVHSPLFFAPWRSRTIVSCDLLCFLYIRTTRATWRHSFDLLSPGKPSCTPLVNTHLIQLVSSPDR